MPRLSVVAGPSLDALVPISVNSGIPHNIVSDAFEGQILAYVKGFTDDELQNEYFQREERRGITWSIQTQGRFLRPISADDVLFGNTFDRPLKLPWGSGAALKFMHFVDPTLEHDLASNTKPWALSPLISTMPHFAHKRVSAPSRSPSPAIFQPEAQSSKRAVSSRKAWPPFPPPQSLSDDMAQLHFTLSPPSSHSPSPVTTPHLSRQPSSSGRGTPDLDSPVLELLHPGNAVLGPSTSESSPSMADKLRSKKNNRLSTASIGSLLSASHDDRKDRKERKRTEKLAKHEQALQELRTADRRRAYFRDASHRQEVIFGPEDIITTDFCYGFLQFTPTLSLNLPGGISFDLMNYWDGQPVRFMCCERKRHAADGDGEGDAKSDVPWGRVLWCVVIELVSDEPQPQQPPTHGSHTANGVTNGSTNGAECHRSGDCSADEVE